MSNKERVIKILENWKESIFNYAYDSALTDQGSIIRPENPKPENDIAAQIDALYNDWNDYPDVKPKYDDRYLIQYQYKDGKRKAFFIADWCEDHWMNLLNDITVIRWKPIEPPKENQ